MTQSVNPEQMRGQTMLDRDGDKIGKVEQLYYDERSNQIEWALVNTGRFGRKSSFVPLRGAQRQDGSIQGSVGKDQVSDAPTVDAGEELSQPQEQQLFEHYGVPYTTAGTTTAAESEQGGGDGQASAGTRSDLPAGEPTGRDFSGPETDEAMTRSEEEIRVHTESRERGRARLRKHVVTEHERVTVPVAREEVRIEREPVDETDIDSATSGPEISEEEHEITLHEQRPVVDTETVPKERVRMTTERRSGEETVEEPVRKERIDIDEPDEG
jgi:uncharacterized protein (TIGR02271 family)